MANPLLLLARALLTNEAVSRAAPFAPQGIQQLLPNQSLAQNLAGIPSFLGYLTGLKQEQPSGNLPTDYTVSPTGVMDTTGNQMVTGQGVINFQPFNQYGLNMGFNPNADNIFEANDVTGGGAQGPGGEYNPFQITQIPSTEYESWWNPIDVMDLMENLPAPSQQQEEEETYDTDNPMSYAAPQPILFPRQANVER